MNIKILIEMMTAVAVHIPTPSLDIYLANQSSHPLLMYRTLLNLGEPCIVGIAVRALMVHEVEWRLSLLLTVIAQDHLQCCTSCQTTQ